MSNSPNTIFTGSSRYANDLAQVLTRAVAIASLPLKQLNNGLNDLESRASALDGINTNFVSIQTALTGLGAGVASSSATVADTTILTAHADPTTFPGTYFLNVIDPGAPSTTLSLDGLTTVGDPATQSITTATSLTLTVDGTTFTIAPSDTSLSGLAAAINTAGAGVTATIINIGSPSAPDFRLSLQSEALGNVAIQLNDGSQDLLQSLVTGSPALYQVNGLPSTPISSNSRTVTVAPGLTAELLNAGSTNIVVARTSSALATALSAFVTAYNAAVDSLAAQHGKTGGALTGDAVIPSLSQALRTLNSYTGSSGAVQNLSDLGIKLDQFGKLTLDQNKLDSVVAAHSSDVAAFLGSSSTSGFLKVAGDVMTGLEDPINGTLPNLHDAIQEKITAQNQDIVEMQDRIDTLQANLTARMAAADALIASLEQQVSYFTTLFDSINKNGKDN